MMKSLGWSWGLLPLFVLTSFGWSDRAAASVLRPAPTFEVEAILASNERVQQSRELYETGQFDRATRILQQAADDFAAAGNNRARSISLSNLSLAYQQLGKWVQAQEAIETSIAVLDTVEGNTNPIRAQILQVRAQLKLATGQAEAAFEDWQQASEIYNAIGDDGGKFASQINQAQALQALGLYRKALKVLAEVEESLRDRPDSVLKAHTLLGLGNTLRVVGRLQPPEPIKEIESAEDTETEVEETGVEETGVEEVEAIETLPNRDDDENRLNAIHVLKESADIATRLKLPELKAKADLSLGNTSQSLAQRAKESSDRFSNDRTENNNDRSEKNGEYYRQRYETQLNEALLQYQSAVNMSGVAPETCINESGTGVAPQTCIDAQLNILRLWVEQKEWAKTGELISELQPQIAELPSGRFSVNAQVNLAQSAIEIERHSESFQVDDILSADMARMLLDAAGEARSLKDSRAESFALGTLGKLYQLQEKWSEAQEVTQKALQLSQAIQASSISYQWQWQLGQVLKVQARASRREESEAEHQKQREAAIAAYGQAVATLQTLRGDLVAITPDLQFSFRDSIEPIYREFVDLLLQPPEGQEVSTENLKQARDTIEALQLAELDNFFREACIDADPKQIDDVDPKAAVIYSIVIGDRLEVIAALPGSTKNPETGEVEPILHHETTRDLDANTLRNTVLGVQNNTRGQAIASPEIESDVAANATSEIEAAQGETRVNRGQYAIVRVPIGEGENAFLKPFQDMYDWLVRPIETELATSQVETLVFVLDGVLRNVPMSVLHDGEKYLIEDYAIAVTPGLQLLSVNPIQEIGLTTLAAGLSKMPEEPHAENFGNLPAVENELDAIEQQNLSQVLRNERFTSLGLQNNMTATPSSIVHLATHGQFSSNAEETYIISWDKRIDVNLLNSLLRSRDGRKTAIELLVLSACETAVGDDRAALGLAGVAVRAGARSTVASLWAVGDASTAELMTQFYQELSANREMSKAQALRKAQLSFLEEDSSFQHPLYWGAFVLLGNWQ